MFDFDPDEILNAANASSAFRLAARHWTARVGLDLGGERYELVIEDGRVAAFAPVGRFSGPLELRVAAPADAWEQLLQAVPPPRRHNITFGSVSSAFQLEGDMIGTIAPYFGALQEFVQVLRTARSGASAAATVGDVDRRFDSTVGRYLYIRVDGVQYRVYFETAGDGPTPLLLQHTAGADGRQWRHVLEDADYQRNFRIIAYDLPYHGRSLPPAGVPWWSEEYRLTKDFLLATVVAIADALELVRPVFMGCSIGGHLAPDLALHHPDRFRAVIAVNGGLATPGRGSADYENSWFHPRVASDWKAALMYSQTAPTSPEPYRRETAWIYAQGGPPALKGDVHYYSRGHDLTAEQARTIDTSRVAVYLLTGEYDFLAAEGGTGALAACIPGCHFQVVPGLGHFGPAENPDGFKAALLPVLDEIALAARSAPAVGPD
jgi:pimeloyl-ACP methyl ester carboxylesterase